MAAADAMKHCGTKMTEYFPLGVYSDWEA
jgi:hypothetical protein